MSEHSHNHCFAHKHVSEMPGMPLCVGVQLVSTKAQLVCDVCLVWSTAINSIVGDGTKGTDELEHQLLAVEIIASHEATLLLHGAMAMRTPSKM